MKWFDSFLAAVLVAGSALFAADPELYISFNRTSQADFGGTGTNGGVLEGFLEPIGVKPRLMTEGGSLKEENLLMPGLDGKAFCLGSQSDGKIYSLLYQPRPAIDKSAGTISLWVRPEDWQGNDGSYHVFYAASGGVPGQRIFLYKRPAPDNDLALYYGHLSNKIKFTMARFPVHNWKTGEWHHICAAYDSKVVELHIDGVQRSVVPLREPMTADLTEFTLGDHWNGSGNPGKTLIDEVRIFNGKRLNTEEMVEEYKRLAHKQETGAPITVMIGKRNVAADGVVREGEYTFSGGGFLNVKKNIYASLQSNWRLAYDEQNLYLGMISEKAVVTGNSGPDTAAYSDDCVELYLSGLNEADTLYQFVFNAGKGSYDCANDEVNWNAEGVKFASHVVHGKWHFECAIPWKNFGFKPANGAKFRCNICRTHVKASELTQVAPSINGAYGAKNYFAQVVLQENAPEISLPKLGALNTGALSCQLEATCASDDKLTWKMEALDSYKPFIYSKDFTMKAQVPVTEPCDRKIPLDRTLEIEIMSEKLGTVYQASVNYHNQVALVHKYIYTDIPKDEMVFVYGNNTLGSGKHKLIVDFVRVDDGQTEKSVETLIPDDSSLTYGRIDVSKLTPGCTYFAKYRVLAPDGQEIINGEEEYGYFKHGAPWNDCTVGLEDPDKVLPPWTPVKANANGRFECWGRVYQFGGNGVLDIQSQGKKMLTSPVMLLVDGRNVPFKAALVDACDARAHYLLTSTEASIPLQLEVRAEFEGMLFFKLLLKPRQNPYSSVKLVIPMDRQVTDGFDDCSNIFNKLSLRGKDVKAHYDNNFVQKPFFWCGGDEIGLMGGTQSKRGWYLKDKNHSMALDLDEKTVKLTINLVDTALTVSSDRKLEFYLDATPVKAKRLDTARARERINIMHGGVSGKYFCYYQPGYLCDWEMWIRRRVEQDGRCPVDKMKYFGYICPKGASPLSPGWHYYASRWVNPPPALGNYSMLQGVFRNPCSWTWTCLNEKSHFDYQLSNIPVMISPNQFNCINSGFYFDLTWPRACANTEHGCVWKDEFGYTHQDNDVYALWEYYVRVYRVMKKWNPDAYFYAHTYHTRTPSDSFFDLAVCGEMYDRYLCKNHCYYDVLTPELMRIMYASRVNEMCYSFIPQFLRGLQCYNPEMVSTYDPAKPEWDKPIRHLMAYQLLHHMYPVFDPWRNNETLQPAGTSQGDKIFAALDRLGWEGQTFHGYYRKDAKVHTSPKEERLMASFYACGNKLLLVVLNDQDVVRNATVALDAPFAVSLKGKDVFSGKTFSLKNGNISLTLGERDSAFILFE